MLEDPVLLALATLAVAYAAFCFVAESVNPLAAPRGPLRRPRWRFGRRVGLALLVGGALASALPTLVGSTPMAALVVGGVVALAIAFGAWLVYRRRSSMWGRGDGATS